jgi:DNA-binding NtrC family response regulator
MKSLEGKFVVCADPEGNMEEVRRILQFWGCQTQSVKTTDELVDVLKARPVDLIVAFVCHTSPVAPQFFPSAKRMAQLPPVVAVACNADVDLYLEAMEQGAFDCVSLPLNEKEFSRIISRALLERPALVAPIVV